MAENSTFHFEIKWEFTNLLLLEQTLPNVVRLCSGVFAVRGGSHGAGAEWECVCISVYEQAQADLQLSELPAPLLGTAVEAWSTGQ